MPLNHKSPNAPLLRELQEVSEDAQIFLEALRSSNSLSGDFPAEQLSAIAVSLCDLPNGTAEGCKVPLEYARARLPAIRREHIVSTKAQSVPSSSDAPPPTLRGEDLDQKLRNLISSVTTALDEYRRQATEPTNEDIEERSLVNPDTPDVHSAIDQASTVEGELRDARHNIIEHATPDAERPQTLARNLADAQNLSRLVNAELGMREVVARWYRGIANAIQKAPLLIRAAGNTIEASVDIVEPYAHWWHEVWADIEGRALHHLRGLGTATKKVADDLEARQNNGKLPSSSTGDDYWPKHRIKTYFVEGRRIPKHIAEEVTDLAFGNMSLKLQKVEGIKQFPNLTDLGLARSHVVNLEPLRDLPKLHHLDLSQADAATIAALPKLDGLVSIYIFGCNAQSLEVLAAQPRLRRIYAGYGLLKTLRGLGNVPHLFDLDVSNSGALQDNDLVFLTDARELAFLSLFNTKVSSLAGLETCTSLSSLNLTRCPVVDLRPLSELHKLSRLTLSQTKVADLSPLASLRGLRTIDLQRCARLDVSLLAACPQLKTVELQGTEATGVEKLVQRGVNVQLSPSKP